MKSKQSEAIAKWRSKNPEKSRAHREVYFAIRRGALKKEPCFCGDLDVQAHHYDYSKPLDVEWLCKKHHVIADAQTRIVNKYDENWWENSFMEPQSPRFSTRIPNELPTDKTVHTFSACYHCL